MSTYPKGPREMAGGMMWFPRLTDKIRLCARGELPEAYHANLGERFDQRCAGFLRVEYPALRARVLAGGTDEEILEWCYENGRRLNELDLFIWNSFVSKFGWNDERTVRVNEMKTELGVVDRADLRTLADMLDFDEKRKT